MTFRSWFWLIEVEKCCKSPRLTVRNLLPKLSKVEAAKTLDNELRDYFDKRHNVHKGIKDLVTRIQGTLESVIKEWKKEEQKADAAELELAVVVQQEKFGTSTGKIRKREASGSRNHTRFHSQKNSIVTRRRKIDSIQKIKERFNAGKIEEG